MSWTYFTAPLAAGSVITRNQRNELLDAFNERLQAIFPVGDGFHADMSAVYASDVVTDRIKYTVGGSTTTTSMRSFLFDSGGVFTGYDRTDTAATVFSQANFKSDVATVLGVSSADIDAVVASRLETALTWNAIREGLRLLKVARMPEDSLDGLTVRTKIAAGHATFSGALTAFYTASEFNTGGSSNMAGTQDASGANPFNAGGGRITVTIQIPAIAPFTSGYEIWGYISDVAFGTYAASPWRLRLSSLDADISFATAGSNRKSGVLSGVTSTGTLVLDFAPAGFWDSSFGGDFTPAGSGASRGMGGSLAGSSGIRMRTRPNFTHP